MRPAYAIIVMLALSWIFFGVADAQNYKMYVQKMPPHWQKSFGDVLDKAIAFWQQKTPGLTIEKVPYQDKADFVLEWASQYDSGKLGYYTSNTLNEYGKPKLTISLGYFKDKKWILVSPDYALEITKHELGHAIGLSHSTDPTDVMYPQIENYESWLQSHTAPKITNQTKSIDWKAKATTLQTSSDKKLYSTKAAIALIAPYVNSTWATNKASQAEMSKAEDLLFAAKKFQSDAELFQSQADDLYYSSKYSESYQKYKASLDRAKKIDSKIIEIKKSLKKANSLEFGQ
jgi:hypothetical protein